MRLMPGGLLHRPPTYKIMHLYADRSGGMNQVSVHAITTATCEADLREMLVAIAACTCRTGVDTCRVCLYQDEAHYERKQPVARARFRCDALTCTATKSPAGCTIPVEGGVLELDLPA
jgi:hypothetical protein